MSDDTESHQQQLERLALKLAEANDWRDVRDVLREMVLKALKEERTREKDEGMFKPG